MVMRVLTYLVASVAILIGIFLSSIPSQLGFYRWLAIAHPFLVSGTRQLMAGIRPWGFI